MIILDLTPSELNFVESESQKQGITVQEYFKNMLSQLMPAKQEKPLNPMIARAMSLDKPTSYTGKDPVELQREWRNEW